MEINLKRRKANSSPPQRPKMTEAEARELYAQELESRFHHENARLIRAGGYCREDRAAIAAILRAANGE